MYFSSSVILLNFQGTFLPKFLARRAIIARNAGGMANGVLAVRAVGLCSNWCLATCSWVAKDLVWIDRVLEFQEPGGAAGGGYDFYIYNILITIYIFFLYMQTCNSMHIFLWDRSSVCSVYKGTTELPMYHGFNRVFIIWFAMGLDVFFVFEALAEWGSIALTKRHGCKWSQVTYPRRT